MVEEQTFTQLREQGFRLTPQRLTILRILQEDGGHLTPVQVFDRAQTDLPGLTETTVYRALNFLTENGLAQVAHHGGGQLAYEYADHTHDHLICRCCGASLEIDHTPLAELFAQIHQETGFQVDSQHVTFFGRCPACQERDAP